MNIQESLKEQVASVVVGHLRILRSAGWTLEDIAKSIGTNKSRVHELTSDNLYGYSIKGLLNLADKLGYKITIKLEKKQ